MKKYIIGLFIVFTSVTSAQITFPSGFDVVSPEPIDTRFIVADSTARVNLTNLYKGLRVYQESDSTFWYYGRYDYPDVNEEREIWHLSPEGVFGVYDGTPVGLGFNVKGTPYIRPMATNWNGDWEALPIMLESNQIYFGVPTDLAGYNPGFATGRMEVNGDSVFLFMGTESQSPDVRVGNTFFNGGGNYSGKYGTGFGHKAGLSSTGEYLTAVGASAGAGATGNTGTFVGVSSGYNSSGYRQVGVGNWALLDAAGDYTVGIGTEAGDSSYCDYGIFIGSEPGRYNNGNHSIGIGFESMVLLDSPGDSMSIGIGYIAGFDADAAFSIYIGYGAGQNNDADNVVALGYQAGLNNTTANQFIVKQANINATPLMQGDFSTGMLSISGGVNYAADAQGNDDYEISLTGVTSLTAGLTVTFIANTANTDGATLEITEVGDLDAILKMHDQALASNDIEAGQIVVCVFDGTNWQMTSQLAQ